MARKLDGDMPAALHACQQALYLYEQHRNRGGIAETLGELGHLHLAMRQLEEAVLAYRRMAELCQQLGDGLGEEAARNNLANVLTVSYTHLLRLVMDGEFVLLDRLAQLVLHGQAIQGLSLIHI